MERTRAWARLDLGLFARAFFPHYCRVEESNFHHEIYELFSESLLDRQGQRIAVAAPRESAKSTIAALFLPLWCICCPDRLGKKYLLVASDTAAQAEQRLAEVKRELEDNELLAGAFPEATGQGEVWKQSEIVARSGVKLTARGTGGNIRGLRHGPHRPDLLIGDDLENDENSQTPEQRDKITNWFYKAFSKAGARDADILVIGTILHMDSLLSRLLDNPAYHGRKYRGVIRWSDRSGLWEQWERIYTDRSLGDTERRSRADCFFAEHREEMTAGTEVLWPGHRSYYDLMKLRLAEGPASFDSEIQNEPVNPQDCLFQSEWFRWYEEDGLQEENLVAVAAVDPSLGGAGDHHDPSAIVCLGLDTQGYLYVLEADIQLRTPDRIIEDTLELYLRRRPVLIGVETVQFQEFFKDRLAAVARERGIYPPLRGIRSTRDKKLRIQRLQPLVRNGTLRFAARHRTLFDQLRYYPKAAHDDGPDALEMAVQMAEHLTSPRDFRFDKPRTTSEHLRKVFG
ncbi:MAG: phage terminase large subunit [Candidatus Glassbacteria bacterium]|nr:phage terminase large subunit [Candidatus Glassbacteria bacterium]